jgi:hypothetical protein
MRSGITIVAGLLAGVVVAVGILAAFVLLGPDPVGLRPTPAPTVVATASPSLAASVAPSSSAGSAGPLAGSAGPSAGSAGPSGSAAAASPGPSASGEASQIGFDVDQPAPAIIVAQVGGGTIDLSNIRDAMAAALTKILPGVIVTP